MDETGKEPGKNGSSGRSLIILAGVAAVILLVGVCVIAYATLFYLGVFNPPSASISKRCITPAGLTCYDFYLDNSGNLNLDLGQAIGRDIIVTGMGCGDEEQPQPIPFPRPVTITSGSHEWLLGGDSGNTLNCCPASGGPCQKHFSISYKYAGSEEIRNIYGQVSGPLEAVP